MNKKPKLIIALLAAGQASRFGSPKQLAYFQGQTLLQRSIDVLSAMNCDLLVITGAHQQLVNKHLNLESKSYSVVFNQHWQQGMSSSIKAAVTNIPKDCEGIMFATVDQIHLTIQDIQLLIDRWYKDTSRIVCAEYAQHQGVPAIFPHHYFPQLLGLENDKGARQLIKSSDNVSSITLANAEIDIDTPEQLNAQS